MQYPSLTTGLIDVTKLNAMLEQTFRKDTPTPRASTTTAVADPFFTGIAIGVGTWKISAIFHTMMTTNAATAAVAGIKINWQIAGGAWSGVRSCRGIAFVTGNTTPADVSMRNIGSSMGTDQTYGGITTANQPVHEDIVVTVSTPGSLSVNWAQATSNANATILGANSLITMRQIE